MALVRFGVSDSCKYVDAKGHRGYYLGVRVDPRSLCSDSRLSLTMARAGYVLIFGGKQTMNNKYHQSLKESTPVQAISRTMALGQRQIRHFPQPSIHLPT